MLIALALAALSGCPRDVQAPPPEDAFPCVAIEDCNASTCGELRACVDGLCEAEPSLVVPCPGGGSRVDASLPVDASRPSDAGDGG